MVVFQEVTVRDQYFTDVDVLGDAVSKSIKEEKFPSISMNPQIRDILIRMGVEFSSENELVKLVDSDILKIIFNDFTQKEHQESTSAYVSKICGIEIRDSSPTRIGARLGRPEKAGDRKMKPMVHSLFPVESAGNARRSIADAARKRKEVYKVEADVRSCHECGMETPAIRCPECGSPTVDQERVGTLEVDINQLFGSALQKLGLESRDIGEFKGVKKLMSGKKYCNPDGVAHYIFLKFQRHPLRLKVSFFLLEHHSFLQEGSSIRC